MYKINRNECFNQFSIDIENIFIEYKEKFKNCKYEKSFSKHELYFTIFNIQLEIWKYELLININFGDTTVKEHILTYPNLLFEEFTINDIKTRIEKLIIKQI